MKKLAPRSENLRRALAQEAARIMSEHGIRDFLTAKRKAAEVELMNIETQLKDKMLEFRG